MDGRGNTASRVDTAAAAAGEPKRSLGGTSFSGHCELFRPIQVRLSKSPKTFFITAGLQSGMHL